MYIIFVTVRLPDWPLIPHTNASLFSVIYSNSYIPWENFSGVTYPTIAPSLNTFNFWSFYIWDGFSKRRCNQWKSFLIDKNQIKDFHWLISIWSFHWTFFMCNLEKIIWNLLWSRNKTRNCVFYFFKAKGTKLFYL